VDVGHCWGYFLMIHLDEVGSVVVVVKCKAIVMSLLVGLMISFSLAGCEERDVPVGIFHKSA